MKDDALWLPRRYVPAMSYPARRLPALLPRLDPTRVDELVGVLLAIEIELQVWLSPYLGDRLWSGLGGAALAIGAAVRRRWPFGAVLLAFGAVTVQDALGGRVTHHSAGALLALFLIFYGAGAFLAERRAWLALGLGVVALSADTLIATTGLAEVVFPAIFLLLLPWAVGRMLRERGARERAHRESAERLDAEREHRAATAAYGERARIARELHDVIAHSVSVMVIQAAGARTVMDSEPDRAEASLRSVERAGREALTEMRRLLGVLGGGDKGGGDNPPSLAPQPGLADVRDLAPQPGLADVRDLVDRTCAAGLTTDLHVEGQPAMLSPTLDLCAFRIVQEGLTNAIKHAGPAHATVRVRWAADALELEVSDDGRGARAVNGVAGGHGIAGMRERAALHGGSIHAGPSAGGGFIVRAHLPLTAEGVR
ncbi:MAG TPA: sensor histidine kinase [Solirubrobacteraceae bacterium]|jgi:signal transduction histidine kinase|nr:sensor histidine kinase [Solirubrobacteraceae bacterium]